MNKKNAILIILIFLTVFSMIIVKPITNLDELWNYNTARAISEGLIPYKDISMITTPALPMVTALFLKIIANEVIISRILASCMWTGILFITYNVNYWFFINQFCAVDIFDFSLCSRFFSL